MKKLKLNVGKINELLDGRPKTWLAEKTGQSKQTVCYWLDSGSLVGVVSIAQSLGVDAMDIMVEVEE